MLLFVSLSCHYEFLLRWYILPNGQLLYQSAWPVPPNNRFGVFHIFLYCDWNLVCGSQRQKLAGARGLSRISRPPYMSLSCHEACKRSLILRFCSWRCPGKVMHKYWNLVDTPCTVHSLGGASFVSRTHDIIFFVWRLYCADMFSTSSWSLKKSFALLRIWTLFSFHSYIL